MCTSLSNSFIDWAIENKRYSTFLPDYVSSQIINKTFNIWLYCENHLNGFRKRANNPLATFTEFPDEYRPGAKPFHVKIFEVLKKNCTIFKSNQPNSALEEHYLSGKSIKFPVHPVNTLTTQTIPNIEEIVSQPFKTMEVNPTSSTRTVFVLDKDLPAHCIKPHTNLRITRWRRHMESRKIKHAVAVTRIFEKCIFFKTHVDQAYFPESIGIVYGGKKATDWGFIVREMAPKPETKTDICFVPFCSLYMTPEDDPTASPLILKMIENSGKKADSFILEDLIYPILRGWFDLFIETGVLLEPHGQNIVLEIDPDTFKIVRFVHRDFDCEVNIDLAKKGNFDTSDLNQKDIFQTKGDEWAPQGSHLSLLFDNSISVPFDALAEIAEKHFDISRATLQEKCRKFLKKEYSEFLKDHFPSDGKTYNYKELENGISIVEKPSPPKWR